MPYSMTSDMSLRCGELSATGGVACRYPGNRTEGDTVVFRTPHVAGTSLFPAVFENGQYVVEARGNLIDGGTEGDVPHSARIDDAIRRRHLAANKHGRRSVA